MIILGTLHRIWKNENHGTELIFSETTTCNILLYVRSWMFISDDKTGPFKPHSNGKLFMVWSKHDNLSHRISMEYENVSRGEFDFNEKKITFFFRTSDVYGCTRKIKHIKYHHKELLNKNEINSISDLMCFLFFHLSVILRSMFLYIIFLMKSFYISLFMINQQIVHNTMFNRINWNFLNDIRQAEELWKLLFTFKSNWLKILEYRCNFHGFFFKVYAKTSSVWILSFIEYNECLNINRWNITNINGFNRVKYVH